MKINLEEEIKTAAKNKYLGTSTCKQNHDIPGASKYRMKHQSHNFTNVFLIVIPGARPTV